MGTTVLVREGGVSVVPSVGAGPQGAIGPAGTAANNSGIVTTVPAAAVTPGFVGHAITGGGGAYGGDKGIVIDMANGSLSAIDIHNQGTGYAMRFFDSVAGHLVSGINDGNAYITAAWIGIYAGLYTTTGSPGDSNYNRVYHPPMQIAHMFGIHADVQLAEVVRGYNGANPMAKLYMLNDGYGDRLDMANGSIRFARTDSRPYIGDVNSTSPAAIDTADLAADFSTMFALALEPFNAGGNHGFRLRSYDVGTIGELKLFVGVNGGIAGSDTGLMGVQHESGIWRFGNASDATIYNAVGQHVWEIAGTNTAWLKASGFHPLASGKDLGGEGAVYWRDLYLSGVVKIDNVQVLKEQGAAVADATDAGSAITQLNALLARCRAHGFIAT